MSASLASVITLSFFCGGCASSVGSSVSQSSNIVRDTFELAPDSTDAACVSHALIICTDASSSASRSDSPETRPGCDCSNSELTDVCILRGGFRGGGHGCIRLCITSAFRIAAIGIRAACRITTMHGEWSLCARSSTAPANWLYLASTWGRGLTRTCQRDRPRWLCVGGA
jgi:hypothetical protein